MDRAATWKPRCGIICRPRTRTLEVLSCAPAAGALTLAAGGSISDAFKSFAFAWVSMGVWDKVGGFLQVSGLAGNIITKALVHGLVGGALSVAQGGDFTSGFAANAIGAAAGFITQDSALGQVGDGDAGGILARTAISAAAGGTASVLTGGKFANGAITGAFAHLFNDEAHALKWGAAGVVVGSAGGFIAGGGLAVGTGGFNGVFIPEETWLGGYVGGAIGYGAGTIYDAVTAVYSEGAPELPGQLTDENGDPQGKRINTDLPADRFPGVVEDLTAGQLSPHPKNPANLCCSNGVIVRPTPAGPRIDIPASGSRPHETIHFPQGTKWPY